MKTARVYLWLIFLLIVLLSSEVAMAAVGPRVNVMPDGINAGETKTAYAWAGQWLEVWGNVKWGDSSSGSYSWDFGDGTPAATGTVSDARNIAEGHTYATGGTTYYATLTVTDGNGLSDSDTVRIDVLTSPDPKARISLSIERGLKWLYLGQNPLGDWSEASRGGIRASTALSVLAFENRGHLAINDPDKDIYAETVKKGLDYLCAYELRYSNDIGVQPAGNPDKYGVYPNSTIPDGFMIDLPNSYRSNYEHGMVMMAFAAAGPYKPGSDPYDASINPALNLTSAIQRQDGGTIVLTYYDILAGMIDYVAWAQADSGGGRGGWRYSGNDQDSDNSVAQWNPIGCEAAEGWGLFVPDFVKSELLNYEIPDSFDHGPGKYNTGGWAYQVWWDTGTHNVAHAGAGICMLSWCGVPQTSPLVQHTLAWLDDNWDGNWNWYPWNLHMQGGFYTNFYAMYGVAKGCRIARDTEGHIKEILLVGSRNWYDVYASYIMNEQLGDGSWGWSMSWVHSPNLNTPWAILVLEPNISRLTPVADIKASPNPTPANQPVNFDISASYHLDSRTPKWLQSWQIDFDSDGSWDASGNFPVSGPIKLAAGYPDLGHDYTVNALLRVTDNVGQTDDDVVTVKITSGNVSPVADPSGPYRGSVGFPVTLDGSKSYDPNQGPPLNDEIVSYEWDINGDGVYGDMTGKTVIKTWSTPYVGKIGLRVTDKFGLSAVSATLATITVTDLWPVSYNLISQKRITRNVWEYVWTFTIENRGNGEATNVKATLNNWPSNVQALDGAVVFGTVAAGQKVTSPDTFKLRIDRSKPVANTDLTWIVEYTDPGGNHWKLTNFPLFP